MMTPVTKRIAILCVSCIAAATMFVPEVEFQNKLMVVGPIITGIFALVDGGK